MSSVKSLLNRYFLGHGRLKLKYRKVTLVYPLYPHTGPNKRGDVEAMLRGDTKYAWKITTSTYGQSLGIACKAATPIDLKHLSFLPTPTLVTSLGDTHWYFWSFATPIDIPELWEYMEGIGAPGTDTLLLPVGPGRLSTYEAVRYDPWDFAEAIGLPIKLLRRRVQAAKGIENKPRDNMYESVELVTLRARAREIGRAIIDVAIKPPRRKW